MTAVEAPESMTIRPATSADLLAVYQLECECFPFPWPYQAFLSHLDAPTFLLAEIEDELAGYLVADISPTFSATVGHIKNLAVSPTFRRQGIASCLIDTTLPQLLAAGADRAMLEVREENHPAQALYRSFRFHVTRVRPGYYEDGTDAFVMARPLP